MINKHNFEKVMTMMDGKEKLYFLIDAINNGKSIIPVG